MTEAAPGMRVEGIAQAVRDQVPASPPPSTRGGGGLDSPLFIIGTGRCGTTALMDLIAYHRSFAWPSQYTARWPGHPRVAVSSRIVEIPPFSSRMKFARFVPKHAESYDEWNQRFPGFAQPFRDLVADDVTPRVREQMRSSVRDLMKYQAKPRFITKFTGWSRIGFLRAIFPDAKFIHIVRDGRAVAYSYTTMPWWDGWGGMRRSRWATADPGVLDELDRYGHSFMALAALQWKMLIDNISETSRSLPERDLLVLRYEDMVRDPSTAARRSLLFAGVDEGDRRFARHLSAAARRIVDPETRPTPPPWKQNLSPRQLDMIDDLCGEELSRFGYA